MDGEGGAEPEVESFKCWEGGRLTSLFGARRWLAGRGLMEPVPAWNDGDTGL